MRIALVSDKSSPWYTGGYENRVFDLARTLAGKHEVKVVSGTGPRRGVVSGVSFVRVSPTLHIDRSGGRNWLHTGLFAGSIPFMRLGDWAPDVTIIETIPYVHLPLLRFSAPLLRGRIVLDVSEAWGGYSDGPGFGPRLMAAGSQFLLGRALPHADLVLTTSEATKKSLQFHFGVEEKRSLLLPSGVDVRRLQTAAEAVHRSRNEGWIDFVTVGRLVPIKRHLDFIRSLAYMRQTWGWNGRALIIGDGPLKLALSGLVRQLRLDQNVAISGYITDEQKTEFLARSRVFALSSSREGLSLATIEAQACGLPAVVAVPSAPEVFGVSTVIQDGRNGLYYPVGDYRALAMKLHRILTEPGLRQELSRFAVEDAWRFDSGVLGNTLDSRLRELVGEYSG